MLSIPKKKNFDIKSDRFNNFSKYLALFKKAVEV